MSVRSDQELLQDYLDGGSESAFTALVHRHMDVVYSAALRRVGDPHLARDVTQGTFIALAQNARRLKRCPVLSGWLHRTTRNIAINLVRTNTRRHEREQELIAMNQIIIGGTEPAWKQVAPHLDAALDELDALDRDAILLRYFEKKPTREIAVQLGISYEAAQKRICRALDRLRELIARDKVEIGAGGLSALITTNAVSVAPAGLAASTSTVALATTVVTTGALTAAATKPVLIAALQKTVVTTTIVVLASVSVYEARQSAQLRAQHQASQQEQEAKIRQLQQEQSKASNKLIALQETNERFGQNSAELLKLRGQAGLLISKAAEADRLRKDNIELKQLVQSNATFLAKTAQSGTIAKVLFTPVNRLPAMDEDSLRARITSQAGNAYDPAAIDNDIKSLYETGWFRNIRVTSTDSSEGVILNYVLEAKPELTQIRFTGNSRLSSESLAKLIKSKAGQYLDEKILYADAKTIEEAYQKSGSPDAMVKYVPTFDSKTGTGDVVFNIVE